MSETLNSKLLKSTRPIEIIFQAPVLNREEAAIFLNCSTRTIDTLLSEGRLAKTQVNYGSLVSIRRTDLDKYLEENNSHRLRA